MSGGKAKQGDLFLDYDAFREVYVKVDIEKIRNIDITFGIDKRGMYVVHAKHRRTKEKLNAEILKEYLRQQRKAQRRIPIECPPGMRLNRFAQFVFTKRFRERFLTPCLADTQQEYFEALQEGDLRKARWVSIRGVLIFWWTVLKQIPLVRRLWTLSGG